MEKVVQRNKLSLSTATEVTLGIRAEVAVASYVGGVLALVGIDVLRASFSFSGVLGVVVGSAPNFVAALSCPFVVPALLRADLWGARRIAHSEWAFICCAISQAALIGWEFAQGSIPGMVFDIADIAATLIGGALWRLLVLAWLRKHHA